MAKDHGKQIKDDRRYEAMRREGMSKEKAARIANTPASKAGKNGGRSSKYEDLTKNQLYGKAKEIGIPGRASMNKGELISKLRNH